MSAGSLRALPATPSAPWVVEAARLAPDRVAVRCRDLAVSWSALARESETLAAVLARHGVVRGDVVAVRMAPHPRFVAFLHALQMLGAAMLPLNLRLAAPEIEAVLDLARPRLLLDDSATPPSSPFATRHPFDDFRERPAPKAFAVPARIDPAAALTIVQTSGTTAAPKAVVLSNANHAASAAASRARLGHGGDDTWLVALPLYHVGGLAILARSVLDAGSVLLEPGFDPARLRGVLAGGDATMVPVVPTMLARALDDGPPAVSPRLRCVLVGGAALSPALARRALDAGLPVSATWGMTETCSQACTTAPGSEEAAEGGVGLPLDGFEVDVAGADAGGWGRLRVRGPAVTAGYLAGAATSALHDDRVDGWLVTGDIGRLDGNGRLTVGGRADDVIVSGGENVSPLEVERVLDAHGDVRESLVVGVPDPRWGQCVVALVVPLRERAPDPAALRAWCRERVAGYKVPREFRVVDDLPRGPTGKPLRRAAATPARPPST